MPTDTTPTLDARDAAAREALCHAAAALDAAEARGRPHELCAALAQLARGYRGLGTLGAARGALLQALRWAHVVGAADAEVDLLCELAETECLLAERHEAAEPGRSHADWEGVRDHVYEATRRASHASDPRWEARVLLRLADVLDRCGDHADAAALQGRALARMGAAAGDTADEPGHAAG